MAEQMDGSQTQQNRNHCTATIVRSEAGKPARGSRQSCSTSDQDTALARFCARRGAGIYDAVMRAIVQRVTRAEVSVAGRIASAESASASSCCSGVAVDDTEADAEFIADRILGLRVFADAAGKMNLALDAVGGELLVISQFTLLADTSGGRRPSFIKAAPPEQARAAVRAFPVARARCAVLRLRQAEFGAHMELALVNDGPVTIILDSRVR